MNGVAPVSLQDVQGPATRCSGGRAEEEARREAEVKAIEGARYEREMEMTRQEEEEDKARRKEAYARCGAAGRVPALQPY